MFWSGFWNSLLILTGWTQAEKILTLTSSGPIQGRIQQANGRNYGVYIGIPYAQPPVGALRLRVRKF